MAATSISKNTTLAAGTYASTYYQLVDTSNSSVTLTLSAGAILSYATANPLVSFKFSNANTMESLANSGTIMANGDRAVYAKTVLAGDAINITNTSTGVIEAAYDTTVGGDSSSNNDDAIKVKATVSSGSITIDNSGLIRADSYTSSVNTGVYGSTVSGQAIDMGDASGFTLSIVNETSGQIISVADDAIKLLQSSTTVTSNTSPTTIINHGTITGGHHCITGDFAATITNDGTITGQLGSGINMDTTSVSEIVKVYNLASGVITGHSGGATDGDAIDVDYTVYIENSGRIEATGSAPTSGSLAEALAIGGGTVINYASGVIKSSERAITVDDSNDGNAFAATTITNAGLIEGDNGEAIKITDTFADTLTNSGTITGSVDLGAGSDVIDNSGTLTGNVIFGSLSGETATLTDSGTITGSVSFGAGDDALIVTATGSITGAVSGGAGDDSFSIYAGATLGGAIDGGAGDDIVHLYGSGSASFGDIANIETVEVDSGAWTIDTEAMATLSFGGALNITLAADLLSDGAFASTISGFTTGDELILAGLSGFTSITLGADNLLTLTGSTTVTLQLDSSVDYSGTYFTFSTDASGDTIIENVICFYPGTRIATPAGEVAVETLRAGDQVVTAEGRVAAIRWMGRQTVSTRFADPLRVLPIRIRAGALGDQLPKRDLLLSPDHALLLDGVLVHAGALVNGVSILRERAVPERFTYWHVELADHQLVLAEGAPAESFIDHVDRLAFDNWDEHDAANAPAPIAEMNFPRAKSARQLPGAIRRRLQARRALFDAVAA